MFFLSSCSNNKDRQFPVDKPSQNQITTDNALAYLEKGKKVEGDHYKAIEYYSKAIEIDSHLAEAYSLRGFEKQRLNDLKGAIEDYKVAIRLNPNDYGSLFNTGSIAMQQDDFAEAINAFRRALVISKTAMDSATLNNNIGLA